MIFVTLAFLGLVPRSLCSSDESFVLGNNKLHSIYGCWEIFLTVRTHVSVLNILERCIEIA